MPFPGGGDDDSINIFVFQKFLVSQRSVQEDLGLRFTRFGYQVKGAAHHVLLDVAQGENFDIIPLQGGLQVALPPKADPDKAQPKFLVLVFCEKRTRWEHGKAGAGHGG